MTTEAEAREALYLAFQTGWTPTGYGYTFDNEKYSPPTIDPWARFVVRTTPGGLDTIGGGVGNRRYLRNAVGITQVFIPAQQGATSPGVAPVDTLSRTVREIFEGNNLLGGRVWFKDVEIAEIGPSGKWFQTNITASFQYEEIK